MKYRYAEYIHPDLRADMTVNGDIHERRVPFPVRELLWDPAVAQVILERFGPDGGNTLEAFKRSTEPNAEERDYAAGHYDLYKALQETILKACPDFRERFDRISDSKDEFQLRELPTRYLCVIMAMIETVLTELHVGRGL